jgi:hypothetical protein
MQEWREQMNLSETISLSAECDFCGASNEMTMSGVGPCQDVRCSLCGGRLGTVEELREGGPQRESGRAPRVRLGEPWMPR